jgi:hypothetical protein
MGIESKGNGGIRAVVLSAIIVLAMVGGPTAVVGGTDTDDPLTDDVGETLNETSDDGGTTDLDDTDEGDSTESDGGDDSSTADADEDSTSTSDGDDSTTDEVAESADDVEDTGGAVTDAAGDGTDDVTDGATIDRVLTGTIDTGSLESRIVGVAGIYERSGSGAATQQTASTTDDGGSDVESDPGSVGITAGATNQPGIATQGEGPATLNFTESEPGAFPDTGTATLSLSEDSGVTFDTGNTSAAATVDGGSGTVTDVGPTKIVLDVTSTDPNTTTSIHLDGLRFESAPNASALDAVWRFGNTSDATAVEPERLTVNGFDEDVPRGAHGTPDGATAVLAYAQDARSEGFVEENRNLVIRIPEHRTDDVAFDTSASLTVRTGGGDCGLPIVGDQREEEYWLTDQQIVIEVSCEIGSQEYLEARGIKFNVSGASVSEPPEIGAQLVTLYEPVDRIDQVVVDAGDPVRAHAPDVTTDNTTVESNATDVAGDGAVTVSLEDDIGNMLGDGSRITVELEDTGVTFNDSQTFEAAAVSGNTSASVESADATTVELQVDGPSESGDTLRIQGENGSAIRFDVAADAEDAAFSVTTTPGSEDVTQRTETVVTVDGCESIPSAVDENDDGRIGDFEVLDAIEYWRDDAEVPGTCGETIDDFEVLDLIETWRNDSGVS